MSQPHENPIRSSYELEVALKPWDQTIESNLPDDRTFREKIQPRLAAHTVPAISSELGVSLPYATDIRRGGRIPHPRHWLTLAGLVGVSQNETIGGFDN